MPTGYSLTMRTVAFGPRIAGLAAAAGGVVGPGIALGVGSAALAVASGFCVVVELLAASSFFSSRATASSNLLASSFSRAFSMR